MARLQITNSGMHPIGTKVVLDGHELRDCQSLELRFDVDDPPTVAIITIAVDELDVDAQALLMLEAAVNTSQEERDGS